MSHLGRRRVLTVAAALAASLIPTAAKASASQRDPAQKGPATQYSKTPSADSLDVVGSASPHDVPHLDGGISDQASITARHSALARIAIQLYQPFETGNTAIYDRILTEDFLDVPLAPGQGPGRLGMARHVLDDIVATFPDARFHIEAIHVAGNVVTVRGAFTGTQERTFLGIPATGRQLQYRTVDIHQFAGERIARTDHMEDFFAAYRQMTS